MPNEPFRFLMGSSCEQGIRTVTAVLLAIERCESCDYS
jgi:hypothetical protein